MVVVQVMAVAGGHARLPVGVVKGRVAHGRGDDDADHDRTRSTLTPFLGPP